MNSNGAWRTRKRDYCATTTDPPFHRAGLVIADGLDLRDETLGKNGDWSERPVRGTDGR